MDLLGIKRAIAECMDMRILQDIYLAVVERKKTVMRLNKNLEGRRVMFKSEEERWIPGTVMRYMLKLHKYKIKSDYNEMYFVPEEEIKVNEDESSD